MPVNDAAVTIYHSGGSTEQVMSRDSCFLQSDICFLFRLCSFMCFHLAAAP